MKVGAEVKNRHNYSAFTLCDEGAVGLEGAGFAFAIIFSDIYLNTDWPQWRSFQALSQS